MNIQTPMEWNGNNNINNNTSTTHSIQLKETVRRFIAEVRNGNEGAFYDPQFSPVVICLALTASWHSVRRWRQLTNALPEDLIREELATFWAEIKDGEDVISRGATLNARLGRMAGL